MPLQDLWLLVVDDDLEFSLFLEKSFAQDEDFRYHITFAANGADARTATQTSPHPFQVLVIDQRLPSPDLDGIALMQALHHNIPHTLSFVLTANTSTEDELRAIEAGAADYIYKSAEWAHVLKLLQLKIRFHVRSRLVSQQAQWLQALNRIGEQLQACVTRDALASAIIMGATELGYRHTRLWQVFQDDGGAWLRGWKQSADPPGSNFAGFRMFAATSPYTRQTLASRAPQKYSGRELGPSPLDALTPPPLFPVANQVWLDIALWNEKQCLAKLSLFDFRHALPLDGEALHVVELFAQQAAMALHRVLLQAEQELEKDLADINERPVPKSEFELDRLLDSIYDKLRLAVPAPDAYIALYDEETKNFEMRLHYKNGRRAQPHTDRFDKFKGLVGEIMATQKPLRVVKNLAGLARTHHGRNKRRLPQSYLGVPIRHEGRILGAIVLRDFEHELAFTEWDERMLMLVAAATGPALYNARTSMEAHRATQQMEMLQYVTRRVLELAPADLDKTLHVVLTAITASYGLRLNRALLLLRPQGRHELVGRLGIGHVRQDRARTDWRRDADTEMTFEKYLEQLEQNGLRKTPLEERAQTLRVSLRKPSVIRQVFESGKPEKVPLPAGRHLLPDHFCRVLEPEGELGLFPVRAARGTIGVLAVDNRFNRRPITEATCTRLQTFVDVAAWAIDNAQNRRTELRREDRKRKSLSDAQEQVLGLTDPAELPNVLDSIVERAKKTLPKVDVITLFYMDPVEGDLRRGGVRGAWVPELIGNEPPRMGSAVYGALELASARFISDSRTDKLTRGRFVEREDIASTAVFPLREGQTRIGCMFFSYRRPQHFTKREKAELLQFSDTAALALHKTLDDARIRLSQQRSETVTELMRIINRTQGTGQVVAAILAQIRRVITKAHHAAMLHYEESSGVLRFDSASADTYPMDRTYVEPEVMCIARRVVQSGKIAYEPDVSQAGDYLQLIPSTRSELCVPIQADKMLGILVLESDEPAAFTHGDEEFLTLLAAQAAFHLKKTQEYELLKTTQQEAMVNGVLANAGIFGAHVAHTVSQYHYIVGSNIKTIRERLGAGVEPIAELLDDLEQGLPELDRATSLARLLDEGKLGATGRTRLDEWLNNWFERWKQKYPGINIQYDLNCVDLHVRLRRQVLEISVEKLASNAAKAMARSGNLTITSRADGSFAFVRLQDSGKGIPEEIQKEFLLRHPMPRDTFGRGSGFGLLLARKLLTDRGGDLYLIHSAPGQGATFELALPLA